MKIVKNNTGSDVLISDIGINVLANSSYTFSATQYAILSSSEFVIQKLSDGTFTYNDGNNDLSLVDAIAHINGFYEKIPRSSIQNAQPVIMYKSEEESFARATHDFCDKTTWYSNSVRVEGETPSVVGLVYTLANNFIIDVYNGKVNRQDTLQQYRLIVYDNGVETTNYTVNYRTGVVTLLSSPTGTITVDYSYATNSEWVLSPNENKILIIEHSEIQFSTDVIINTPLRFEIWVTNPLDPPNKILYSNIQYNSLRDFVNEANLGTGIIPAMSGLPECVVFPFNYASIKPFKYSTGAELRIKSVDDLEINGSFGTATFYLISRDE